MHGRRSSIPTRAIYCSSCSFWQALWAGLSWVFTGENYLVNNEIFADIFARRENLLTKIDARIKVVVVAAAIFTVISALSPRTPLISAFLVITGLMCLKIPFRILFFRLAAPFGIAATLFLIKVFYHELDSGLLMMAKIIGSTSLILFLSMTTTLEKLLAAGRWFKVPSLLIEI